MAELHETGPIGLKPQFSVHVVGDRQVLLLSEERSFRLKGKLYVALVPYLDGTHTPEEIIDAFKERAPEERVRFALSNLLDKDYAGPYAQGAPDARQAFWVELGLNPVDAERSLGGLRLAAVTLGRSEGADAAAAERFGAAMSDAGIGVAEPDDADLLVALVDDYLQPELAELNERMRADGRRWLPLKPGGSMPYLGPVFRPDDGPCWACLAKRLRENRPGDGLVAGNGLAVRPARARTPASLALAMNLAAVELARLGAGAEDAALERHVLSLNLKTHALRRHLVHWQPHCPVCGSRDIDPLESGMRPIEVTPQAMVPQADGGWRVASAEDVLSRLETHVSPLTGIIGDIEDQSLGEGLPVFAATQNNPVHVNPRENRRVGRPNAAAGKGMTTAQAKVSCLAEAVERYCSGWTGVEPRKRARLADLGDSAIHPYRLLNYSEAQYKAREEWNPEHNSFNWVAEPFDAEREIEWTPCWSLTRGEVRWVPTRYCYFGYQDDREDAEHQNEFCGADSNGCASGSTLEEAILQGFLELVERDACGVWWYNRLSLPGIDLASFDDPFVRRVEAHYAAKGRQLYALDLTNDVGIPAIIAVSHDADGGRILFGLGAHLDGGIALSRALAEINQMVALDKVLDDADTDESFGDDSDLETWIKTATIENQPYVLPADGTVRTARDFARPEISDLGMAMERCREAVERCGLELIALDMSRPEIDFHCARVMAPGIRHFWARFAPGRLYEVPIALGWQDRKLEENELNPIPFFL